MMHKILNQQIQAILLFMVDFIYRSGNETYDEDLERIDR